MSPQGKSPLTLRRSGAAGVKLLRGNPRVVLSRRVYDCIRCLVDTVATEVAFLGTVRESDRVFYIDEIFIVDQDVSKHHARLHGSAINILMEQFVAENGSEQGSNSTFSLSSPTAAEGGLPRVALEGAKGGDDRIERLRFWGQSHNDMEPDPSSVDDVTFAQFQRGDHPWFLQGIFSKDGGMRIDVFLFAEGVIVENVPVFVDDPYPDSVLQWVTAQVTTKVRVVDTPEQIRRRLMQVDGVDAADFQATEAEPERGDPP